MPLLNYLGTFLQTLTRRQNSLWQFSFLIVITYFLAKSANLMIAHVYLPLEFGKPATPYVDTSKSASSQVNIQMILSRNIFDSEIHSRTPGVSQASGPISPSTLPLELLGTIVFKNSRFSVALIRDRSSKKSQYYAIGDNILSARVNKIERFRVVLEINGRLESLELKAAENKIGGAAIFKQPDQAPNDGNIPFEEVGPNKFVIPQSVVDDALNNFSKILTQARMVPNLTSDNKTDGFKVFQIHSGSIYEKLGMKDNDIIKRVNGQDLDSFEKATGLFTALRNEKTISIDLVRNGTRINYSYEIR